MAQGMIRIVIFAKAPVTGKVKTRLIPKLGAESAARLAHKMLLETYEQAASVSLARTELCVSPAASHPDWQRLLPAAELLGEQGEGDLGKRLARTAERVIGDGEAVVLIGTDCPGMTTDRLERACRDLETHDAVIHPAYDGGYALLGLNRFDASIFSGIAWSTPSVARDTIGRIGALGWTLHISETLRDIDEPGDLEHLAVRS